MNVKKLTSIALILLTSVFMLSGCLGGGGAPINNGSTLYGQLLGPVESAPNSTFTAESLQVWISGTGTVPFNSGTCNGIPNDLTGRPLCNGNINYINSESALFGFSGTKTVKNFITTQNPLGINNVTVTAYKIRYTTPGAPYSLGGNTTDIQNVSGALLVPNIPESNIKGALLYYHGTILSKFDIPSNFSSPTGLNEDTELAAIFGSQGYIVVVPDYVGQGDDSQVVHPYVAYAETNAQSGIYMLQAARVALESMGISKPLNLYVSSYSEGGGYALKTAQLAQPGGSLASVLTKSNFNLTRTVGVSGAYDLTGAMLPFAFSNANNSPESAKNPFFLSPGWNPAQPYLGESAIFLLQNFTAYTGMALGKVALGSYLIAALSTYNYDATDISQVSQFLVGDFGNMNQCFNIESFVAGVDSNNFPCSVFTGGQTFNLLQLFSDNSPLLTQPAIVGTVSGSAIASNNYFTGGLSAAQFAIATANGTRYNNVGVFLKLGAITQPAVFLYLEQQNTYNWVATAPVSLIYMYYDSTVTNLDSKAACGLIPGKAGVKANSASGLVSCVELNNTNLVSGIALTLPGTNSQVVVPIYLDHAYAEPILQLIALHQIQSGGESDPPAP